MDTENLLKKLLEADKKAQELVLNAEEEYQMTVAGIDRLKEEFCKEYKEKAEKRIGLVKESKHSEVQAETDEISQRYDALMQNLEQKYSEKHKEWEEEIIKQVLNK